MALAVPVITWAAIGQLGVSGHQGDDLDYMYRAPEIPHATGIAVTVLAVLIALASAWRIHCAGLRRTDLRGRVPWTFLIACCLLTLMAGGSFGRGTMLAAGIFQAVERAVHHASRGHWLGPLWAAVTAGMFLAALGRIVTAGGNGANIGGGAMLMVAPFVFLGLAAIVGRYLRRVNRSDASD